MLCFQRHRGRKALGCLRNQSTTVARVQGERKGTQPSEGGGTAVARA